MTQEVNNTEVLRAYVVLVELHFDMDTLLGNATRTYGLESTSK